MKFVKFFICTLIILCLCRLDAADDKVPKTKILTLNNFIREACRNDTRFQEILAAELSIKYNKVLILPKPLSLLKKRK